MVQFYRFFSYIGIPIEACLGVLCGLCFATAGRMYLNGSAAFALLVGGIGAAIFLYRILGNVVYRFFNAGIDAAAKKKTPEHALKSVEDIEDIDRAMVKMLRIALFGGIAVGVILGTIWSPTTLLGKAR